VFQRHPERVPPKSYQHVGLDELYQLVKQGSNEEHDYQRSKGRLRFGQLDEFLPKFCSRFARRIDAQQISCFAEFPLPVSTILGIHGRSIP